MRRADVNAIYVQLEEETLPYVLCFLSGSTLHSE